MTEAALAREIARLHFGPVVGAVARVLLEHPGLPLGEIARRVAAGSGGGGDGGGGGGDLGGVDLGAARDALCVLLAHGAAVASPAPLAAGPAAAGAEAGAGGGTVYRAEPGALLARTRLPLYLGLGERRFGALGRAVLDALFQRGRLTAAALFELALDGPMAELAVDDDAAAQCLADMARAGMLRWAGSRARGDAGARGARKRAREADDDDESDEGDAGDGDGGARAPRAGATGAAGVRVGTGFNARVVGAPARANDDDVWAASFWFLDRCFRNEACKMVVAGRLGAGGGGGGGGDGGALAVEVLITGLNIALAREDAAAPTDCFETCEVSTEAVHAQLRANGVGASGRDFWHAVRALVALQPPCVVAIPEHAPSKLKFVPGRLIAEVRQQTVEEMVVQRYRKAGRRIFRALALDGCMEDKLIAERCMLDVKAVREKLFCMHRDRLVSVQEVARSHEAQRASNWYYLWRVRLADAYAAFLDTMCKTQLNLLLKLETHDQAPAPVEDETAVKLQRAQRQLLVASVLRVDQAIMVMRDFGPLTASYFPTRYKGSLQG